MSATKRNFHDELTEPTALDNMIAEQEEMLRAIGRIQAALRATLANPQHMAEVHLAQRILEAMKDQRGHCDECDTDVLDMSSHDCPAADWNDTSAGQYAANVAKVM